MECSVHVLLLPYVVHYALYISQKPAVKSQWPTEDMRARDKMNHSG